MVAQCKQMLRALPFEYITRYISFPGPRVCLNKPYEFVLRVSPFEIRIFCSVQQRQCLCYNYCKQHVIVYLCVLFILFVAFRVFRTLLLCKLRYTNSYFKKNLHFNYIQNKIIIKPPLFSLFILITIKVKSQSVQQFRRLTFTNKKMVELQVHIAPSRYYRDIISTASVAQW